MILRIMNYSDKFYQQLGQGKVGEAIVAAWLNKYKNLEIVDFNDTIDYDIKMTDGEKNITYEVKCDRWEHFKMLKTGNMVFETRNNKKPSGIWATKADYYCYYFPDFCELYFIKVEKLRELCMTRPDVCIRFTNGGDKGNSSGFKINRYEWNSLFEFYKINKLKIWESQN
jgi:hypothetical protein